MRIILIFLLISIFSYAQPPKEIPATGYKVPEPEDLPVVVKYPARVESINTVDIVARVTGILQKKYFKDGDLVKKGQLLYKIEPDIYEAQVEKAKADLLNAQANLDDAEKQLKRVTKSFKENLVSQQEMDNAYYNYEKAKAQVEAAKAALKQAQINLSYTNVISPITGYTGIRLIDVGNLVNPGTKLITITQTDPIYVIFSIPESDIKKFNLYKREKVKNLKIKAFLEDTDYSFDGKIDFVNTVLDKNTLTLKVRGIFKNTESILKPGQFVYVQLSGLKIKNAIQIPQKSVIQTPMGSMVYVEKDDMAVPRMINIIGSNKDYFIVKGVNPRETVIVDNLMRIRQGAKVKIDRYYKEEEK
jgi:membrane fusion protein (multidrug efflux system)